MIFRLCFFLLFAIGLKGMEENFEHIVMKGDLKTLNQRNKESGQINGVLPVTAGRLTVLHQAAFNGLSGLVEAILNDDASFLNYPDNQGYTPLTYAVINQYKRVVFCLLQKGALTDCCDVTGKTALDYAILAIAGQQLKNPLKAEKIACL